jgi:hypothetical protein
MVLLQDMASTFGCDTFLDSSTSDLPKPPKRELLLLLLPTAPTLTPVCRTRPPSRRPLPAAVSRDDDEERGGGQRSRSLPGGRQHVSMTGVEGD